MDSIQGSVLESTVLESVLESKDHPAALAVSAHSDPGDIVLHGPAGLGMRSPAPLKHESLRIPPRDPKDPPSVLDRFFVFLARTPASVMDSFSFFRLGTPSCHRQFFVFQARPPLLSWIVFRFSG